MSARRYSGSDLALLAKEGLSTQLPAPKQRKKRSYEESDNQISFFRWWRASHDSFNVPQCLVFSIPNGSALGTGREEWQVLQRIVRGKRLIAEGLGAGVFDIFVSVPRPNYSGLYVEMKKKGGEIAPRQILFQSAVRAWGYKAVFCYSDQEAINEVTTYLTK